MFLLAGSLPNIIYGHKAFSQLFPTSRVENPSNQSLLRWEGPFHVSTASSRVERLRYTFVSFP